MQSSRSVEQKKVNSVRFNSPTTEIKYESVFGESLERGRTEGLTGLDTDGMIKKKAKVKRIIEEQ